MATTKTLNFLPSIFRTDTNQKFLSATLDQLVQEPDFRKVNGYIGRKFSPTYRATDNYVTEDTESRQNYQLEPSVVIKDPDSSEISLFSSYPDLLNKISYYGGLTNNHDRLFNNESYSFSGLFDYDKFVNFNNYYWIESGPDAVDVFAGQVDNEGEYDVTRNFSLGGYNFSHRGRDINPILTLARGGTYVFNVERSSQQANAKFWIQTEPGTKGAKKTQPNISVRNVLGVINNGAIDGQVIFRVPLETAQDRFTSMPLTGTADFATVVSYADLQNHSLAQFMSAHPEGIDGITSYESLDNRTLIFVGGQADDQYWTNPEIFDLFPYDYVPNELVPPEQRLGIWRIRLIRNGTDYVFNLVHETTILGNQRVFVRTGVENATQEFYIDYDGSYQRYPTITATLDRLYYQDSSRSGMVGEIRLVDPIAYVIDVDKDILGEKNYTSPNGVVFTNGLKIKFDNRVTPAKYAGNEYYVEGVGESISLVKVDDLVTPENYATDGLTQQDYITINRSSIDLNAWSRSNRWFHIDVIKATAFYNNEQELPDQSLRANRPIIEFEPGLRLFDHGSMSLSPIDILDFQVTDAFSDLQGVFDWDNEVEYLEGQTSMYQGTVYKAKADVTVGILPTVTAFWRPIFDIVADGTRIVFAADTDREVRRRIWRINLIELDRVDVEGTTKFETIHLTEEPAGLVEAYYSFVILAGNEKGKNYWYDGSEWVRGQDKTKVNQPPLFDVFDESDISFSDKNRYVNSNFEGTKIFSYQVGAGRVDPILGFPLSYKNFNSVGDISFVNDFDTDSFTSLEESTVVTSRINNGYLKQTLSADSSIYRNVWVRTREKTKQNQILSYAYEDSNEFQIDITPASQEFIPYIKVFVNNQLLNGTQYSIVNRGVNRVVSVSPSLLKSGSKIDILIYSKSVSEIGYYEIPENLNNNAKNKDFSALTLGQIRNHITTLKENTRALIQNGNSTSLRDISIKSNSGAILQHASPCIYANLFLGNSETNFIDSLNLAGQEYVRFKNKFLEMAIKERDLDLGNISDAVDQLLKTINAVKNKSFPWYYSDMLPYGDNRRIFTDTVINPDLKQFDIPEIFNDTALSNRAVLVYVNGQQLIKDRDYRFPQDRTAVIISSDFVLSAGDTVVIVEYFDTNGSYIPETPTKLGLYPKFVPEIRHDDTYTEPTNVIVGHDGSLTVAFNDFRDDLLLEFEKRIYNNIKVQFETTTFDFWSFIPGKFRDTEYTLNEFNRVLSRSFLNWCGANRIDFGVNRYFQSNNPWTWNYRRFRDPITQQFLQGSWRAVFQYFYDTDRPHTHPWEMLGFSQEPSWWQERYGSAPFTGGNRLLWDDLEAGYIHAGDRAGFDPRFSRPELSKIIPVDEYGSLKDPSSFLIRDFNSVDANKSFSVGEYGPAESAWRRSSDYPFAIQRTLALTKPAQYFSSLINVGRYQRNPKLGQLMISGSLERITPERVLINSDIDIAGNQVHTAGYLNWITDYLRSLGIDPIARISYNLKNINVNLAYPVAGYSDKKFLRVFAEQSSPTSTNDSIVIPDENYKIHLNKSSPVKTVVYSAVIVEKTNGGYTVSGYNLSDPYFTIIPSLANNNAYAVTVQNQRGVIYRDYQPKKVTVPYGFEFSTRQQLVDFLISYGRYLIGRGFKFTEMEESLVSQKDWVLAVKEFLHWSQQGWSDGNLIVLSPISDRLVFSTANGVVDEINDSVFNRVLDQNFNLISSGQFTTTRDGNRFTLTCLEEKTICLIQLDVVQYEHVLIFDNRTVFNDVIYQPELGNRQFRLKLVGRKTGSWSGTLEPPGFVYNSNYIDPWRPGTDYRKGSIVEFKRQYFTALENTIADSEFQRNQWQQIDKSNIKTGLLPNFAYNAKQFETAYDIDSANDDLHKYSVGIIGFRERDYLSDFNLDEISQVKFYQGFIKEKGTLNSIKALTSATFNNISSDIDLHEEWAVRVGEYGAIDGNNNFEILLDDSVFKNDPVTVELLGNLDSSEDGVIGIKEKQVYRKTSPIFNKNVFFNRGDNSDYSQDIISAGYVNLGDVDATIYDLVDYSDLDEKLATIAKGFKIWVAKDFSGDWNVYRVNETNNNVVSLSYALDDLMTVNTEKTHGLSVGDMIVIKNFDTRFNGFYQVVSVIDNNNFLILAHKNADEIRRDRVVTGQGLLFSLSSMRVNYLSDIENIDPPNGWVEQDRVWVDSTGKDGGWAVFEKHDSWKYQQNLSSEASEYVGQDLVGSSIKISSSGDIIVAGAPGTLEGSVKTFIRLPGGDYVQNGSIKPPVANTEGFGRAVDISDYTMVVGAPDTNGERGRVFVYNFRAGNNDIAVQVLEPSDLTAGARFGHSVSISRDNQWIYVGAPGQDTVYAYRFVDNNVTLETRGLLIRYNLATRTLEQKQYLVSQGSSVEESNSYNLSNYITWPSAEVVVLAIDNANVETELVAGVDYDIDSGILTMLDPDYPSTRLQIVHSDLLVYDLGFTPESLYSLVVRDGEKILLAGEGPGQGDFHISGSDIVFEQVPEQDSVNIQQSAHYALMQDDLTPDDVESGEKFGWAVKTNHDGSELVVSAPHRTAYGSPIPPTEIVSGKKYTIITAGTTNFVSLGSDNNTVGTVFTATGAGSGTGTVALTTIQAGCIYNYTRRVEFQRTRNGKSVFTPRETIDANTTLWLNSAKQIQGVDYTVDGNSFVMTSVPDTGQVLVISSNIFDLSQQIVPADPAPAGHFGLTLAVDSSGASIYVGAPGFETETYRRGKVYRFVENARYLGVVTGTLDSSPTVNVGDALYINGFVVEFRGSTVESVINDINESNIPGVRAKLVGTQLCIESTSLQVGYKLHLHDAGGSAMEDLGLPIYTFAQSLLHQNNDNDEIFGHQIEVNNTDSTLMISSVGGYVQNTTSFDQDPLFSTTFDAKSTKLIDRVIRSGAVYLFESLTDDNYTTDVGTYVYAQRMGAEGAKTNDQFGAAIDIHQGTMVISSPGNDNVVPNGGIINVYNNQGIRAWDLVRQQEPQVDLKSVNRILIYGRDSGNIITNLDYIDPAKGKILGIAEQDIDYKTSQDPAIYSSGDTNVATIDRDLRWGEEHVGNVWWDLGSVRYIDYEQGSLVYRGGNWASTFPGSQILVYEWVESTLPPAQYQSQGGDGEPLYLDTYSESVDVDRSGIVRNFYYFWVKNKKNSAPRGKQHSVHELTNIIRDPELQSVPYAALLKSNAIALYGLQPFINGQDSVLQISYGNADTDNTIHTEFDLIQEGRADSIVPQKIIDKMIDSLAGIDRIGNVVPDPSLNEVDSIGISVRPRQTMVRNRARALENLIKYINKIFIKYPIVNQYNIYRMLSEDPVPSAEEYDIEVSTVDEVNYINTDDLSPGFRVLVRQDSSNDGLWSIWNLEEIGSNKIFVLNRIQSYKTSSYWHFVNWYADDYDPTSKLTYTVDLEKDMATLSIQPGDTIKIRYSQSGKFTIYRSLLDGSLDTVGIENGTLQIDNSIYDLQAGGLAFDASNFDVIRFDKTPSVEIRKILEAVQNDIFIGELKSEFNKLFFVMINYIFSEQKNIDWIFKTSFVNVVHKLRKLEQYPNFIRDNQDYYLGYINEVKPYRTQLREYLLDYSGEDTYSGDVTDFDLPSYYDEETGTYRSPNGEREGDAALLQTEKYRNWKNNYSFEVDDILIAASGQDFTLMPSIEIIGGGGTGATGTVNTLSNTNGIASTSITNQGSGYTSTPDAIVNGNGTGAKVYPVLRNDRIRKIKSTVRFDRVSYESSVMPWTANSSFFADIVTYQGEAYEPDGSRINLSVNVSRDSNVIELTNPARSVDVRVGQLVRGPGIVHGPGITVTVASKAGADITLSAVHAYAVWENGQRTMEYDTIDATTDNSNGEIVSFLTQVTTGPYFDFDAFTRISNESLGSALNRINAYYSGGKTADQLLAGLTYPGVSVQGLEFVQPDNDNKMKLLDTAIESYYRDVALGTRPEDISIDGGGYIDIFNSHAPEELVPGITFDTLNMQIFTTPLDESGISLSQPYGHRVIHDMRGSSVDAFGNVPADSRYYYRIAENSSTFLAANVELTDTTIYVEDVSKLPEPGNKIPVTAEDGTIEMLARRPGVVYIGGEKIVYYRRDLATNSITDLRRGVDGTGAARHTRFITSTRSQYVLHEIDISSSIINRVFEIPQVASNTEGNYLVQYNNRFLVEETDYTISQSYVTLSSGFPLVDGDILSVQFVERYQTKNRVVDTSPSQRIPGNADTTNWIHRTEEFGLVQIGDFDLTGYDQLSGGLDVDVDPSIKTYKVNVIDIEDPLEQADEIEKLRQLLSDVVIGSTLFYINVAGILENPGQLGTFPNEVAGSSDAWIIDDELWAWDGASWKNYGQDLILITNDDLESNPQWRIIGADEMSSPFESQFDGYALSGAGEVQPTPQARFLSQSLAFKP